MITSVVPGGGPARSEPFVLTESLTHLLHRADQVASEAFARHAGEAGLTSRQFAVLHACSENDGASQSDLVQATGIDRSTLADIVRRLVDRGLLSRERSRRDARAYELRTTNAGAELLAAATAVARQSDEALLRALRPEHRERLLHGLQLVISALDSLPMRSLK